MDADTARKLRAQAMQYVLTLDSTPVEMRACRQCDEWANSMAHYIGTPPCSNCDGAGVVFIAIDKLYSYDGIQIA